MSDNRKIWVNNGKINNENRKAGEQNMNGKKKKKEEKIKRNKDACFVCFSFLNMKLILMKVNEMK